MTHFICGAIAAAAPTSHTYTLWAPSSYRLIKGEANVQMYQPY